MLIHTPARAAHLTTSRRATRTLVGTHDSVARRHAVLTAVADRHNVGTITVGRYLTDELDADDEFAAFCDSPLGVKVRAAYKAIHGEDPQKIRLVAVGRRLHRKVGYRIGEPALAAGAQAYVRTRELVANTPATATPEPAPADALNPQFIVAHTTVGHCEIQSVDPASNGRSADGIDYADFDEAKAAAARYNTERADWRELAKNARRARLIGAS